MHKNYNDEKKDCDSNFYFSNLSNLAKKINKITKY